MSRIGQSLKRLAQSGKKAVVPYIVAGDPDPALTVDAMHALVANGADIIELGVPFSDPMAEGPVIQLGHERALAQKVSLRLVLDMVADFRREDTDTPVVLMGYANPVVAMGYEHFAQAAADAGVDGVLTVDLPPEECDALNQHLADKAIDTIFLIAPTTNQQRIKAIVDQASGYIYYVSLKGVTGAGHLDSEEVLSKVSMIKDLTDLPVCVGFGIKDKASAQAVSRVADGVVVGSVLVDALAAAMQGNPLQGEPAKELMIKTIEETLLPIAEGANA